MNVFNQITEFIGSIVPINMSHISTYLYTGNQRFQHYWQLHSDITNANHLVSMIESRVGQEKIKNQDVASAILSFHKEEGKYYAKQTFIKFILASLIGLWMSDIWIPADFVSEWRIFLCILITIVCLFYVFLKTIETKDYRAAYYIEIALSAELIESGKTVDYQVEAFNKFSDLVKRCYSDKQWYLTFRIHQLNWVAYLKKFAIIPPPYLERWKRRKEEQRIRKRRDA